MCIMATAFRKIIQSPFLRLGNTVVNEDGIANQSIDGSILENNIEKSQMKETKYKELKKGIFIKRSKTSTCEELLIRWFLCSVFSNVTF